MIIRNIIFAIIATSVLPYILNTHEAPAFLSCSVISAIICCSFFLLIDKASKLSAGFEKNYTKPNLYLFSILLTTLLVIGRNIVLFGNINYNFLLVFKYILIILSFSTVMYSFLVCITYYLFIKKAFDCLNGTKIADFFEKNIFRKSFFIISCCWLPFFIGFLPGIMNYDICTLTREIIDNNLSNWHPVLYTIYLNKVILLGRHLFKSDDAGLILCIIPQILVMISVMSYCIKVLNRNKIPVFVQLISLIFFAFYPLSMTIVFGTTYDSFFCSGIMLLTAVLFDTVNNELTGNKLLLVFFSCLLICFFRNNGILVLSGFLITAFLYGKNIKLSPKLYGAILVPVILFVMCFLYIYPACGIKNIRSEEYFSLPLHQLTTALYFRQNEQNEKDLELYYKIIPNNIFSRFYLREVDCLKYNRYDDWMIRTFDEKIFYENFNEYAKLWIKTGKKYPKEYLNSFLNLTVPYWYPDYVYKPEQHSDNQFIAADNDTDIFVIPDYYKTYPFFPNFRKCYQYMFSNMLIKFPLYKKNFITGIIFSTGLPLWIMLVAIFCTILTRKKYYTYPLTIPCILTFLYLFGPTYTTRYNLPLIMTLPFAVAIICFTVKTGENEKI